MDVNTAGRWFMYFNEKVGFLKLKVLISRSIYNDVAL